LSSGQKPYANVKSAIRAWDHYNETGQFSPYNPGTEINVPIAEAEPSFKTAAKMALKGRKELQVGDKIKVPGGRDQQIIGRNGDEWVTAKSWGPRNVNVYAGATDSLNRLIKEKGEQGAADWLLSEHPVSELREYNPAVAGKMADTDTGAMILGEKRGPFMQNLHGIESKFTADMWVSRTWNRWMGTLDLDPRIENKGKVTSESDAPRNNTERALMKQSFEHAANKLGLTTSSLQAVLWYYEQALYRAHGLPVESWSFSDAAKRVASEKNAAEGQTDFNFGANEGKPEVVGGVPKPAGKAKGGVVHAFDLINAFKGNK